MQIFILPTSDIQITKDTERLYVLSIQITLIKINLRSKSQQKTLIHDTYCTTTKDTTANMKTTIFLMFHSLLYNVKANFDE